MRRRHVVVGLGSAGCAAVARILEKDASCEIIAIEGGEAALEEGPAVADGARWADAMTQPSVTVAMASTAQQDALGRILTHLRGAGCGGSSRNNAMFYCDLDGATAARWPWTRRQLEEAAAYVDAKMAPHAVPRTPLGDAFGAALEGSGKGRRAELRVERAFAASVDAGGRRRTAAAAFLPARSARLRVVRGTAVRVLLEGSPPAASGVRFVRHGGEEASALCEGGGTVLLCCGAFETPKLLMLSGIGPPEVLGAAGVAVRAPLEGVGATLFEHPLLPMAFLTDGSPMPPPPPPPPPPEDGASPQRPRLPGAAAGNAIHAWATFPAGDGGEAFAFVADGRPGAVLAADLLLPRFAFPPPVAAAAPSALYPLMFLAHLAYLVLRPLAAAAVRLVGAVPWVRRRLREAVAVSVALLTPESVGSVKITSADPLAAAAIDSALLREPRDLARLKGALREVCRALGAAAFRDRLVLDVLPGPLHDPLRFAAQVLQLLRGRRRWSPPAPSEAALDRYCRAHVQPFYHACGTCPAGRVVGTDFRVIGVAQLAVADASVFPSAPAAPTAKCAMMVGALAADSICAGSLGGRGRGRGGGGVGSGRNT